MSKLLLVDDDVELTELLSSLLTLEGFDVQTANNGLEALQKLDESHELVLLDVMMPKLNGLDTLKEIRKVSNVPVMMLTARGEDIDRVLGLELERFCVEVCRHQIMLTIQKKYYLLRT